MDDSRVKLETLARGALAEQFEYELSKVINNIYDPNTLPLKKRKITITLTFEPDNYDRERVKVMAESKAQLVSSRPVETQVYLGRGRDGYIVASEFVGDMPGQLEIDDQKVVNINKEAK